MGYRDDTEAAHARAAALERELAEKEAALDAKAQQLAAKEAELAATRAALKEQGDDRKELEERQRRADEKQRAKKDEAQRKLERLRDKKHKETEQPPEPALEKLPMSDDELRLVRSVSLLPAEAGYGGWLGALVVPGIPFVIFLELRYGHHLRIGKKGSPLMLVGFAVVAGVAWVCWQLGRRWARSRPATEERWAQSRPYRLSGYPSLLARKPRTPYSGGHETLTVQLRFLEQPPANLAEILRGFDKELKGMGSRFSRPSPVTTTRTRGGSTWVQDHNYAVRRWVRRLNRRVLQPLHDAHGLESVTIALS